MFFELSVIKEINLTPSFTQIPNQPEFQKGIMNLRKSIIPLYDLRTILGYISTEEELKNFIGMLRQREQDHIYKLDELHASIVGKGNSVKKPTPKLALSVNGMTIIKLILSGLDYS